MTNRVRILSTLILFAVMVAGCASPTPAPAPSATPFQPATATPSPLPTDTPVPVPTVTRTPPALPGLYRSDALNPLDVPHVYIADTCEYLRNKWDPAKARPGTVAMAIMFHSITDGMVTQADQISITDFHKLMAALKEKGFEAITTAQFADFLENNTKIPEKSVLLIVDDRKLKPYYDETFRKYWQDWQWPVINAWISKEDTPQDWWDQNAELEKEGFVDHQAHGVIHNITIVPGSTEEFMRGELFGAVEAFQTNYGKTPIAYIWPGGNFTPRGAEIAREAGYRLGFTINPRGPVMYNWVPLADSEDPWRPSYIPEGQVNDPLMVLPRYWDVDAITHLDSVILIGQQAANYAAENKAVELEYYDIACKAQYGAIPGTQP